MRCLIIEDFQLDKTTELLFAEYQINRLYSGFIDAAWRQDGKAYANLFAENGEWKLAAQHFRGRAEIATKFEFLLGFAKKVQMIVGQPMLEINGDKAIARTHCTEITKMPDGSSVMAIGIYYDRFVKEGDSWLFRWRHFGLHYRGPMDFSAGMVEESPDYGPFPGMPEWDETTHTVLHKKD